MWIYEIYLTKVSNPNKFIKEVYQHKEFNEYITIKLAYKIDSPKEKKKTYK
jgi:hypothetical protein